MKMQSIEKKGNKKYKWQMSESIIVGILLAFSGGYMDAYTYIFRDHVFANAQTGNIILLGIHIFDGNYVESVRYLFPIMSFTAGVFIAQMLCLNFKNCKKLHWRQLSVIIEIIIMTAVTFMNSSMNLLANSMISLACGIQVQSFRKIHNNSLATTMCIGNLRTATDLLCSSVYKKDKSLLYKSFFYYGFIFVFTLGAVLGKHWVSIFGQKAILVSAVILCIVFVCMFIEEEEFKKRK